MNPSLIGNDTALTTLGNHIRHADRPQSIKDAINDGADSVIANWYNEEEPTPVWVFTSSVPVDRAVSDYDSGATDPEGINWNTDYATNFDAKDLTAFLLMFRNGSFDPTKRGGREFLEKICTGAPTSKTGLLNLATRKATRAEDVLKTTADGPGGGDGRGAEPQTHGEERGRAETQYDGE